MPVVLSYHCDARVIFFQAPVREVAVDMIARGVKYHSKDLALSRSACRVLANLSLTLITVLNNWLDTGTSAVYIEVFVI